MSRFKLPKRRPEDRTPEETYIEAHQRALDSPLLPEQVPGLPSDPKAAAERLKAIQAATENRAGLATMGLIKEIAHRNTGRSTGLAPIDDQADH